MAALIPARRRAGPAAWLAASTVLGLGALALILAGAPWPLPVLLAGTEAGMLATGIVAVLGDSARREAVDRTRRRMTLPSS